MLALLDICLEEFVLLSLQGYKATFRRLRLAYRKYRASKCQSGEGGVSSSSSSLK